MQIGKSKNVGECHWCLLNNRDNAKYYPDVILQTPSNPNPYKTSLK